MLVFTDKQAEKSDAKDFSGCWRLTQMSDLELYLKSNYGVCDREADCYHGTDGNGQFDGCLRTGWRGIRCSHWHPISDQEMENMKRFWND